MKPKTPIAAAVQYGRRLHGHSVADLAEEMTKRGHDWSPDVVRMVENNRRRVDTEELAALAQIQDLPYSTYIDGPATGVTTGSHRSTVR